MPSNHHPSQDMSYRHEVDCLLRKYGFKVLRRPKEGSVIWIKEGVEYMQEEALFRVPEKEYKLACRRMKEYRDGKFV